jgi:prepilin-type N-terminal cleavage/methylation domain-containing protein
MMDLRHLAHQRSGFSLIEVVVSVAIIASVISVMIGVFWQGFNVGRKSQERSAAYSLAVSAIEEFSSWSSLTARAGNPPVNGTYVNAPTSPVTFNNTVYTRNLVISDGSASYPNELKRIDVTVSWGTESYTLTTFKANY